MLIDKICKQCGKTFQGSDAKNSSSICRSCVQKNANEKRKATMLKKYGVENIMHLPDAQDRVKAGMRKKYRENVNSVIDVPEIRERIQNTMIERYGVPYYVQTQEYSENGHFKVSNKNKQIVEWLQSIGLKCKTEFPIEMKSYDILVENTNILIEVDPTYTHSIVGNHWNKDGLDPYYHIEKLELAERYGYVCIHIYDWDDWKKEIDDALYRYYYGSNIRRKQFSRDKFSADCFIHHEVILLPPRLWYSKGKEKLSQKDWRELPDELKYEYYPIYDSGVIQIGKYLENEQIIDKSRDEELFEKCDIIQTSYTNKSKDKTRICKFCGEPFVPNSNRQQYCQRPHIRNCPICGKEYIEDNVENLKRPPVACSYECRKIKREQTSLERYGRKDPGNTKEAREKAKKTCEERYGKSSPLANEKIQEKSKKTLYEKYGVDNIGKLKTKHTSVPLPQARKLESNNEQNNKLHELLNIVTQYKLVVNQNFLIENRSYDLIIPDQNVLIEIDPTYTHNSFGNHWDEIGLDKYYHRDKTELAEKHGYRCIHVFDWDDIDKIVESLQPKTTLYARKCKIFKIKNEVCDEFLKKYHFQGTCRGQLLCLGLVYCDELVEVMTFGKPRYSKKHDVELLRLCTKPEYRVVGGASKLFKFATEYYGLHNIISYCDRSKFSGQVYEQLGMSLIRKTPPQEVWCDGKNKITANLLRQRGFDQLFHTNYGKGTNNNQLMLEHGWLPIYDCGQLVYEL